MKTEVDQVGIEKPKLSNVVDNDAAKNVKLKTKVSAIDTSGFLLKTHCNTDKSVLENTIGGASKKIPYTSGLVKKNIILRLMKLKLNYLVESG